MYWIKFLQRLTGISCLFCFMFSGIAAAKPGCPSYEAVAGPRTVSAGELRKRVPGRFLIIAHRGYSSEYLDNSMDAFKEAFAAGADLIETDIRRSADGKIVLSHDYAGGDTMKELEEKDITALEPLLTFAKNRIMLLFDMKEGEPEFLGQVLGAVKRHGMADQIVFGLRSVAQTRNLRKLDKNVVILGFLSPSRYDIAGFYEAGGDIARIWEADLDSTTISRARGGGSRPIWITPREKPEPTGDIDEERQRALMKAGFDGVLVNDPVAAIATRCGVFKK
jgi:glycerophosphoryl diester phosphodiesterase